MAFVDEQQGIVGQVFEEGRRGLARIAPGEIARIVFDAGAGPRRLHHFQVEGRALLQALGLQQLAFGPELFQADLQLDLDALDGLVQGRPRRHIVAGGIDPDLGQVLGLLAGQGVEFGDGLDLVAEHRQPPGAILIVGRKDFDDIAAAAEHAALEGLVVALVLQGDQVGAQLAFVDGLPDLQVQRHRRIGLDRTDTVDARHRSDDDDVVALQDRPRRRMAHAVDLFVHRAVLLYVCVGARNIGLRLVIVVIRDEILDGVVGKEGPELGIELGRQCLVMGQDQGRTLGLLDDLGHGEGLARAGDPQKHLVVLARLHPRDQFGDRRRLVARRLVGGLETEFPSAFGLRRTGRTVRRP